MRLHTCILPLLEESNNDSVGCAANCRMGNDDSVTCQEYKLFMPRWNFLLAAIAMSTNTLGEAIDTCAAWMLLLVAADAEDDDGCDERFRASQPASNQVASAFLLSFERYSSSSAPSFPLEFDSTLIMEELSEH